MIGHDPESSDRPCLRVSVTIPGMTGHDRPEYPTGTEITAAIQNDQESRPRSQRQKRAVPNDRSHASAFGGITYSHRALAGLTRESSCAMNRPSSSALGIAMASPSSSVMSVTPTRERCVQCAKCATLYKYMRTVLHWRQKPESPRNGTGPAVTPPLPAQTAPRTPGC